MIDPGILTAIVAASVTLAGVVLTLVYNLLHGQAENKRHRRQVELEERRAEFEEKKLAIDLYNQRELEVFRARLDSYQWVFGALWPLQKRSLAKLTPERAREVEGTLAKVFYTKASHCLSADSIEALTGLRDSLARFANNGVQVEDIGRLRLKLLQSLHRDLGRFGHFIGAERPLTEADQTAHERMLHRSEEST